MEKRLVIEEISKLTINSSSEILTALKLMDAIKKKLLIVVDDGKFIGLISIGDIQRAIIKNYELSTSLSSIMRDDYIVAEPNYSLDEIKKIMIKLRAEFIPVINHEKEIINIYFWEELFNESGPTPAMKFDLPVVIMAGGLGKRLRPITNVIPKPLIPLGEKTILEHIFDRFGQHGCSKFYLSVNYKSDLIKYYIKSLNLPYSISYFEENKPLGTAGSLSLLKENVEETFFVSNCDIIIDGDYSDILTYHKENKNDITIVAVLKNYPIPYGTIETGENGILKGLTEKPELTFKINSGLYILEPHLLKRIPVNKFYHITTLIEDVQKFGGKVGVFPLSEKSWKDIGEWTEYLKNNFVY